LGVVVLGKYGAVGEELNAVAGKTRGELGVRDLQRQRVSGVRLKRTAEGLGKSVFRGAAHDDADVLPFGSLAGEVEAGRRIEHGNRSAVESRPSGNRTVLNAAVAERRIFKAGIGDRHRLCG